MSNDADAAEPASRQRLDALGFLAPFPPEGVDEFIASLAVRRLAPGEALMRQDEPGGDLWLVLAGRLGIDWRVRAGAEARIDAVGPGGVVGELALLTGRAHSANVVAAEETEVARLPHAAFDRLAARYPAALDQFLTRLLPRLRRVELDQALGELVGRRDEAALLEIESRVDWVHLRGGETLFRQGDRGEDVYVVVNGRLRASVTDADGTTRTLDESGRGAAVGELALLTGEPRAATIVAVRDSDLVRLASDAYHEMVDRHPRAMLQIARAAATRLRRAADRPSRGGSAPATIAVVPSRPGVPVRAFGRRLAAALEAHGASIALDADEVDARLVRRGIAQTAEGSPLDEPLVAWLSALERSHRSLVLVADDTPSAWTRRCYRQADRVLVVGEADGDPSPGPAENAAAACGVSARTELVLLHRSTTERPAGTARWIDARKVAAHHHLRVDRTADVDRLARRLAGRAVGVVFGGGGARGFAHIGLIRALEEAGIGIDLVGGASIGALVGAAFAFGLPVDRMMEVAGEFASRRKLLDYTLPVVSLMAARKVTALFRRLFGEVRAEDLWTPCFVVSSSLSRARAVVHTSGPLWQIVRASTALPAIFPPLLADDGEVLVDGGVMDNMPIDVMRERCEGGTVIGLNPMPSDDRARPYRFGPALSGTEALLGRLGWFGSRVRAPSILGSVMRATEINSANRMRTPAFRAHADLLIEPPLAGVPILAFDDYAAIVEIGYRASKEAIGRWREPPDGGSEVRR